MHAVINAAAILSEVGRQVKETCKKCDFAGYEAFRALQQEGHIASVLYPYMIITVKGDNELKEWQRQQRVIPR